MFVYEVEIVCIYGHPKGEEKRIKGLSTVDGCKHLNRVWKCMSIPNRKANGLVHLTAYTIQRSLTWSGAHLPGAFAWGTRLSMNLPPSIKLLTMGQNATSYKILPNSTIQSNLAQRPTFRHLMISLPKSWREGAWASKVDTIYPTVHPAQRWVSASSKSKGWFYHAYNQTAGTLRFVRKDLFITSDNICFIPTICWLFERHAPFLVTETGSDIEIEIPKLLIISSRRAILYNGNCQLTNIDHRSFMEQGLSRHVIDS